MRFMQAQTRADAAPAFSVNLLREWEAGRFPEWREEEEKWPHSRLKSQSITNQRSLIEAKLHGVQLEQVSRGRRRWKLLFYIHTSNSIHHFVLSVIPSKSHSCASCIGSASWHVVYGQSSKKMCKILWFETSRNDPREKKRQRKKNDSVKVIEEESLGSQAQRSWLSAPRGPVISGVNEVEMLLTHWI